MGCWQFAVVEDKRPEHQDERWDYAEVSVETGVACQDEYTSYAEMEIDADIACWGGPENHAAKLVVLDVAFPQLYSSEQYGQLYYTCYIWVSHQLCDGCDLKAHRNSMGNLFG
jgi:hypothetical protein